MKFITSNHPKHKLLINSVNYDRILSIEKKISKYNPRHNLSCWLKPMKRVAYKLCVLGFCVEEWNQNHKNWPLFSVIWNCFIRHAIGRIPKRTVYDINILHIWILCFIFVLFCLLTAQKMQNAGNTIIVSKNSTSITSQPPVGGNTKRENIKEETDVIGELVGGFGKWQFLMTILLSLFQIPNTFHISSTIYQVSFFFVLVFCLWDSITWW